VRSSAKARLNFLGLLTRYFDLQYFIIDLSIHAYTSVAQTFTAMTQSDRNSKFTPDFSNLPPDLDRSSPDTPDRSGFEPELGAELRLDLGDRTGFEPELGGFLRQKGVFVDEVTCIGCKHCALTARNTFYIEPDLGRARVVNQMGDSEEIIQEAIDTCPVNCIHWVDYTELKKLEAERALTPVPRAGLPISRGRLA
jgi:ferredoxin